MLAPLALGRAQRLLGAHPQPVRALLADQPQLVGAILYRP